MFPPREIVWFSVLGAPKTSIAPPKEAFASKTSLACALQDPPEDALTSVWLDSNLFAFITPPDFADA